MVDLPGSTNQDRQVVVPKMKRALRIIPHLSALAIAAMVSFPVVAVVGDRRAPFTFESGEMLTAMPRPGDTVTVRWIGTFYRECEGVVHRSIVDSGNALHLLSPIFSVLSNVEVDPGKSYSWQRSFNLPLAITSGSARYKTAPEYWCNGLQKLWPIKVAVPDIQFVVGSNGIRK